MENGFETLKVEFNNLLKSAEASNLLIAQQINQVAGFTDNFVKYTHEILGNKGAKTMRAALREAGIFKKHDIYIDWVAERAILEEKFVQVFGLFVVGGFYLRCFNDVRYNNLVRSKLVIYLKSGYLKKLFPNNVELLIDIFSKYLKEKFGYEKVEQQVLYGYTEIKYITHFKYL